MQQALNWVLSYMEDLACPRSLTVAILARYEEWEQILTMDCKPTLYQHAEEYLRATAATSLLKKNVDVPSSGDLEQVTLEKWLWAEKECFKTNRRLSQLMSAKGLPLERTQKLLDYFDRVAETAALILGCAPPDFVDGRFGPGATMSDKSHRAAIPHKMASSPTLTLDAFGHLLNWSETKWAQACVHRDDKLLFVRGNSYFTVPKTATSLRSCAKEPSINGFYQLGVGRLMRKRLQKVGIDLSSGQDTHRRVACEASLTGEFATIDLSSASDCLSTSLVEMCLPPEWLTLLANLRSPFTRVKGRWYALEKFSSMGNGFTFELETLVFLSLIVALDPKNLVPGYNVYVYGDDIIVPTAYAQDVIAALRYCGFTPNVNKTFVDGPFRESCGGDYYNGESVRPHYTEELPNEPQKYISLANGVRRVDAQLSRINRRSQRLLRSWHRIVDNIPSAIRCCRGPAELGDLVIHDEESRWSVRLRNSIRYCRVYRPAKWQRLDLSRFDPVIKLGTALYLVGSTSSSWYETDFSRGAVKRSRKETSLVVRGGVKGFKVGWVPFS